MRPATPLDRSAWAKARWLVLAPHADDETLGTAALIAGAAAQGTLAGVAFLTDGAGSHPCPTAADRTRLIRRRRTEARNALRLLAGQRHPPIFLDWPDAQPHADDSPAAARTERRIASLMTRLRVDAVATTGADEPHCDHAACYALAERAVARAHRPVALFTYDVWGQADLTARPFKTPPILPGRRRAALRAHASQLGGRTDGFRLPAEKRRMATTDLLYLVNRHARP